MLKVIGGIVGGAIVTLVLVFSFMPRTEVENGPPVAEGEVLGEESVEAVSSTDESRPSSAPVKTAVKPADEFYTVVKVVDGDTVSIDMGGTSETVRLIGVDAPETNDTRESVRCQAEYSTDKLSALISGKNVRLEKDVSQGERDKYNRLLAYLYRDDGLFINEHIIEEGYANEYTYISSYRYRDTFRAAQEDAKGALRGLWSPDICKAAPAPKQETSPIPEPTPPVEQGTEEQTPPPPPQNTGSYTCSTNTYNCTDFATHAEAQAVFDQCGGASNDIHKLDNDKDGVACESLP